jgi:hypothetical protein
MDLITTLVNEEDGLAVAIYQLPSGSFRTVFEDTDADGIIDVRSHAAGKSLDEVEAWATNVLALEPADER